MAKSEPVTSATQSKEKPASQMTDEELKDRLSVVQSDITKANERLIDARNEKLSAARKKVQELNARFADWYYLIDESSYKQLMLKRDVLIGPKAAKSDAPTGAPADSTFLVLPPCPSHRTNANRNERGSLADAMVVRNALVLHDQTCADFGEIGLLSTRVSVRFLRGALARDRQRRVASGVA